MSLSPGSRKLPPSGINLFQLIYTFKSAYESRHGRPALNLSLGNPDTVPPAAIRERCAHYMQDSRMDYHTYAEDNDVHNFVRGMIAYHADFDVEAYGHLKGLPIAGIKSAAAMLPLATALHQQRESSAVVVNAPAYDVIGKWSEEFYGAQKLVWPLRLETGMHLDVAHLRDLIREQGRQIAMIFVIRPGNPSAVGASENEWQELIDLCLEQKIRLVCDAAYAGLAGGNHTPLAAVAKHVEGLEWAELYSVSKTFSHPGARLGVMVGTAAFVEDFNIIKGNTDSGSVPALMAAYGDLLGDASFRKSTKTDMLKLYQDRLDYLIPTLQKAGLKQACETTAGFFTLWKVPVRAFGRSIADSAAELQCSPQEAFNRLVIEESGIVGVHFGTVAEGPDRPSEPLIRYAVCTDVLDLDFQNRLAEALQRMQPEY